MSFPTAIAAGCLRATPDPRDSILPAADNASSRKLNRFLAALPAEDYGLLAPNLRTVSLRCGTVLHDHGDAIEQVYFPHRGMVSLVATMHDGAMVETALLGPAGIVCGNAALGSRVAVGKSIVQLPVTASCLSAMQFQDAAKHSSAIRDLAVRCNELLSAEIQQSVACNALHAIEQRLSRWLLRTRDCWDDDILPFTQEWLAQMLGVRRTSVNVSAKLLQARGAIRCGRGRIRIVDRAALEQSACECYFTLRGCLDKAFPQTDEKDARFESGVAMTLQSCETVR
jgi:CRP-like cAMP-binding protein